MYTLICLEPAIHMSILEEGLSMGKHVAIYKYMVLCTYMYIIVCMSPLMDLKNMTRSGAIKVRPSLETEMVGIRTLGLILHSFSLSLSVCVCVCVCVCVHVRVCMYVIKNNLQKHTCK